MVNLLLNLLSIKTFRCFGLIFSQYPDPVSRLHVQTDGSQNSGFINNLDQDSKGLLLPGCLTLPFDSMTLITFDGNNPFLHIANWQNLQVAH